MVLQERNGLIMLNAFARSSEKLCIEPEKKGKIMGKTISDCLAPSLKK